MGLDTVELVVSFEKYFSLEIPDAVAEQLSTVGDVAEWLGQQLGTLGRRESTAREAVAAQLQQLFAAALPALRPAHEVPLAELLPNRRAQAQYAAQLLASSRLQLPELRYPGAAPAVQWLAKLFGGDQLPPKPTLATGTLADLTDWTVALNYQVLLRPPLHSQYDVEQAVIGLTSDQSGVDIPEISLRSSFTNDLGMD
ncbi:hypothetical protein IC235_04145 [Hymenobacter sp. BT664]|uniref:Carrier domain-containing protein n=1 Tax=Hymenobacter montanus TaxID=2771359 RepID=A0A927BB63_9BACT|nr:hypothetical protein [Hymenobacter montanus]MBD2767085.1 hypothetical protein [Hymenobacter montanus]